MYEIRNATFAVRDLRLHDSPKTHPSDSCGSFTDACGGRPSGGPTKRQLADTPVSTAVVGLGSGFAV
jgi:hypothetical protein